MDCLLSVCDYIVEFYPSSQTLPDGTKVEVSIHDPSMDDSMDFYLPNAMAD